MQTVLPTLLAKVTEPIDRVFDWLEQRLDPAMAPGQSATVAAPQPSVAERADAIFPDPEAKGKILNIVV